MRVSLKTATEQFVTMEKGMVGMLATGSVLQQHEARLKAIENRLGPAA